MGLGEQSEFTCEHVYKGAPQARVITDMCIVTLSSRSIREIILKEVENKPPADLTRNELKIDRAKTASQLARNSALRRASDVLKKDTRCSSKEVTIEWLLDDRANKNREVRVGGVPAFVQSKNDSTGIFLPPFSNLTV